MHSDLPLSRDRFHSSLEKKQSDREKDTSRPFVLWRPVAFTADIDRRVLKKCTLQPPVCLVSSSVMGGFIIVAFNPCSLYKSGQFFTMKELCVTSCLLPLCTSSSVNISNQALLMNESSGDDLVPVSRWCMTLSRLWSESGVCMKFSSIY